MALDHILVDEYKFAETYPTGLEDLEDWESAWFHYSRKHTSRRKDGTISEIARNLDDRTCQTVYQWLMEGNKPPVVNFLNRAERIGLMPFGLSNNKFFYINKFLSYVFWTGCIGKKYQICVNLKRRPGRSLNNMLRKILRINSKYVEYSNGSGFIDCNQNGPLYARVFQQLGLPVGGGKKTNHNLRLPRYIKELVKIVDAGFETKRYRSIALKALEDFVLVLFKTRRDVVTDNYWTLLLHCNKTERIARELGEDVVGLLYYLFPKAEITEDNLGKKLSYNKKRVLWNARIYLKKENLEKLRTHYPSFYKRIDDGKI